MNVALKKPAAATVYISLMDRQEVLAKKYTYDQLFPSKCLQDLIMTLKTEVVML